MVKCPRFIIEYANYKIGAIQNYNTFSEKEKTDAIRAIDRAIYAFRAGLISVDETIQLINREPRAAYPGGA